MTSRFSIAALAGTLARRRETSDGPSGPLTAWSARDLVAAIATRRISAVEVMEAFLDRIDALNPTVNAIIGLQDRGAMVRAAEASDRVVGAGIPLGALHGLPHAVKDLEPVAGLPFTMGSPIFAHDIAGHDSLPVERLRRAGVTFIGKTNTPEFGLGSHTVNPVWGATRNPYDLSRSAGGSSGGAAVALALDMVPLADGSDYGGSLRNPAAWNNVYGFRTGMGCIPADTNDDWLPSPGVVGPMARNVGDLALMLSVMAGRDARAPLSEACDTAALRMVEPASLRGKRIGWSGDFGGAVPFDPGVLDICRQALERFAAMGADIVEVVPDFPVEEAWRAFVGLRHWINGSGMIDLYRDPAKRAGLKPEAIWEIEGGMALSAYDVSALSAVRTRWSRAVAAVFRRCDLWIVPSAQVFPFPIEQDWPRHVGGETMTSYHEWMKVACLVTLAGCPALAVPAGFNDGGLPMGVQIVAPVHGEAACLAAAAAYEQMAGDVLSRGPLLNRDSVQNPGGGVTP